MDAKIEATDIVERLRRLTHPLVCVGEGVKHDAAEAADEIERLRAEVERLREALRLFVGAAYPVSAEIDQRGHRWSEAYLDDALSHARRHGRT